VSASAGWDDALFRRSVSALSEKPQTADGLRAFTSYWADAIDDAEQGGDVTGVEHDVLLEDLHAAVRSLPQVTTRTFSSGASLRVPFTTDER
jgi:hypothetical protein